MGACSQFLHKLKLADIKNRMSDSMSVIIRLLVSKGMELSQISSQYTRGMQHELCANLQGGFWCRALHCELS